MGILLFEYIHYFHLLLPTKISIIILFQSSKITNEYVLHTIRKTRSSNFKLNYYFKGGDIVEGELMKLAVSQGIWAALSICLLLYILKAQEKRTAKQEEREEKYQSIILELTKKLSLIDEVKNVVEHIKR